MKSNVIVCLISFVAGAVIFVAIDRAYRPVQGEWKSTGDGRTVIHSTTGEIRFISTGKTVQETVEANRIIELERIANEERMRLMYRESSALQERLRDPNEAAATHAAAKRVDEILEPRTVKASEEAR